MDTPQVLLDHHLKALRLPTFVREYDKIAQLCADEAVDYPRYLLRLSELELLDRERRATERRIKQARFPVVKSLDSFDFLAIPSLNKLLVLNCRAANSSTGANACWRSATREPAKPILHWRSAWRRARRAIECGLQLRLRWSTN